MFNAQNKIGERLIQRITFYFEWCNLRLRFLGSFHLVLPYCYVVHIRFTYMYLLSTTHALWVNTTALKCTVLRPVTLIEMTKTGFDFDIIRYLKPNFLSLFYKDEEKDY